MIFRLGYVAMTLGLKDCSPSGTVTFTNYNKIQTEEGKLHRLKKLSKANLENTLRILYYNKAMNIHVYRLTSKLIPLASHPEAVKWDYVNELHDEFKAVGDYIMENNFRVSAHPDHYTLINSPSEKVLEDSIRDLDYHVNIFEAMGLLDYKYKLVLHVGGLYKDKKSSVERFKENFVKLPDRIRKRIILENDDKSYTARDVLGICMDLNIPMVLDVHHHACVNQGEHLDKLLPDIFNTWNGETFNPKIHFSSPKSEKDFRNHADDINLTDFVQFLKTAKKVKRDFDIMLEAKAKDQALLKLSASLTGIEGLTRLNESYFEM
ncbi:MAG: UV DNA damage repair endonuclease UvsE [Clostridia bacterium]|nr:UV DNA damage repair endonuclease UvsE [Clostridia bacterium]